MLISSLNFAKNSLKIQGIHKLSWKISSPKINDSREKLNNPNPVWAETKLKKIPVKNSDNFHHVFQVKYLSRLNV